MHVNYRDFCPLSVDDRTTVAMIHWNNTWAFKIKSANNSKRKFLIIFPKNKSL